MIQTKNPHNQLKCKSLIHLHNCFSLDASRPLTGIVLPLPLPLPLPFPFKLRLRFLLELLVGRSACDDGGSGRCCSSDSLFAIDVADESSSDDVGIDSAVVNIGLETNRSNPISA